ncbi:MAG TPA: hypothetical protein VK714_10685 [Myxococcota bacterium]|nr:hypothetical protein [Myxococcota bacterium]
MRTLIVLCWLSVSCLSVLGSASVAAADFERSQGISMHMLPKQVADLGGKRWGFTVDFSPLLQPEAAQPVLQATNEVLAFVRKQTNDVRENGVWIVTTHPDAYSGAEKQLLEDIKLLCQKEEIPIFIARASELLNKWKGYDQ